MSEPEVAVRDEPHDERGQACCMRCLIEVWRIVFTSGEDLRFRYYIATNSTQDYGNEPKLRPCEQTCWFDLSVGDLACLPAWD